MYLEKTGFKYGDGEVSLELVFDVSKRELKLAFVSLKVQESKHMRYKKNKLLSLLRRIKEESNIMEDFGFYEDELTDKLTISA